MLVDRYGRPMKGLAENSDIIHLDTIAINVPVGEVYVEELDKKVTKMAPYYAGMVEPNGFLVLDMGCHACFSYYLRAQFQYETLDLENRIQYEDEPWPIDKFDIFVKGMMNIYNMPWERIYKFWPQVDKQCDFLELNRLVGELRFDKVPEIRTTKED